MIGHFVYLVARCISEGTIEDIFWISHVGTFIGGVGAIFRSRFLVSVALVSLAGHHSFWLVDTLSWLFTDNFLFGTTSYLQDADIYEWLQSSNHFFSMPLLLILAFYQGGIRKHAWLWASLLFAVLAVFSFFISTKVSNVNCVHQLWPGLDKIFFVSLDTFPTPFYIGTIIMINALGNYMVTYLVLILILGVNRDEQS
ncbi:hypothetical protein ACFL2O_01495 [Thermodesulfobacteriota bacterium]